jgi:hypothetical protein
VGISISRSRRKHFLRGGARTDQLGADCAGQLIARSDTLVLIMEMKPRHQCPLRWVPNELAGSACRAAQHRLVSVAWLFSVILFLASCSDRSQEMEEKVTQMQRQLDQTQKQLQAANQALASRAPATTTETSTASITTGGLPSRDAVEQSYSASVTSFRKDLDANLKDFRVESCTTHSVQMPTEFYPFASQLSLALVSNDGKNFTTDIPVKADVTGKWVFPTVAEVTQRIEKANHAASAATSSSRSTAQNQSASGQPAPYMKVDGTFVIQWPDSNANASRVAARTPAPAESTPAPAASAPPPPRAQPTPAQPPSQPGANPVMPVDRDVHIQFPSPP